MTSSTVIFLTLRAAHVLMGALWVGASAVLTFFVMPGLQDAGPAAGPVMSALMRRRLNTFMASIGGATVLTGIYVYWRFTGGFDAAVTGTRGGMVFGTGGMAGLLALIIGGAIVSRNAQKVGSLSAQLAAAPDGPSRAAIVAEMTAARQRTATFGRVVVALQVVAVALMAIGHYV